jgi:MFS family permease
VKRLPRTVVALGIVSLLTDVSSEMIYPLLPAFLVSLGAGGTFVGLVEGIAETTSALLKLGSGVMADRVRRKKPLVVAGYGLASVARPLVAIATAPWHVLAIRFTDRVGKGIRTSPRDALIAQATPIDRRGAAYGFHRAMDHTGALVGPLVAYALAFAAGFEHTTIFALAAIPAAAGMGVLLFGVREQGVAATVRDSDVDSHSSPTQERRERLPSSLRRYLIVVALFTLGNSTDFFLLLRAQKAGVPAEMAPLLWALLHAIKSLFSTPLGALSDRLGRKRVILIGWAIYAAVYLGFAAVSAPWQIWALFVVYGLHFAFVEGAEKALVADLAPASLRGRAFGAFHFTVGICALPASLGFGWLWQHVNPETAFVVGALLAAAAALGLVALRVPARATS